MRYLDGQILFSLIIALVLTWIASLLISRRYAAQVLKFMQAGTAPSDPLGSADAQPSAPFSRVSTATTQSADLNKQNRQARSRLLIVVICLSWLFASFIAVIAQLAYVDEGFGWRRFFILTVVYAWPWIPGLGLLQYWSRWKITGWLLVYFLSSTWLVLVNSNQNQTLSDVMPWLLVETMPTLLYVFLITSPILRTTAPYFMPVFFLLGVCSHVGLEVLVQQIQKGVTGWMAELLAISNSYSVFALFAIIPWIPGLFAVRFLAARLAKAYQRKAFSEPLYLIAGLWQIVLLFQAMMLSHSLGNMAYLVLVPLVLFPLINRWLKKLLSPGHRAPTLLLLRVFRTDHAIEDLFDQVVERWRYSGNTLLIAGKDLALRNLEPDELFAFLSGHLRERFIDNDQKLQQAIADLDLSADADGRFRVNEFFCFDSTWKQVLDNLVHKADRVLMDLRAYTPERQGCNHE